MIATLVLLPACHGPAGGGDDAGPASIDTPGAVDCSDTALGQTLVCAAGRCCAVSDGPNTCRASCASSYAIQCDEPGDCGSGRCCYGQPGVASPGHFVATACIMAPACDPSASEICRAATDCPAATPCCAPSMEINGVTLGVCTTASDTCGM